MSPPTNTCSGFCPDISLHNIMLGMMWIILLILHTCTLARFQSKEPKKKCNLLKNVQPYDTCYERNSACVAEDNFLMSSLEAMNLETCKKHCSELDECKYISFFGPNSFPFSNHCMLFKDCQRLHSCIDCQTLDKNCFDSCGKSIQGRIADNALDVMTKVENEAQCNINCQNNADCHFYTYYRGRDCNFPQVCILQRRLLEPIKKCEHCRTGRRDCQKPSTCHFMVGNSSSPVTAFKFTDTSSPIDLTLDLETLFSGCKLNIVAVGGGANFTTPYNFGGGGSGYVATASFEVEFSSYQVIVGGIQMPSIVKTSSEKEVLIAKSGSAFSNDGYSGGGSKNGNGGSNGEDGKNFGGKGSHFDLSSITELKTFHLSAGAGGLKTTPNEKIGIGAYGGGGGGVLVDGEGPQSSKYAGQGYGGGNSQYKGDAGSGVVLVEISKP